MELVWLQVVAQSRWRCFSSEMLGTACLYQFEESFSERSGIVFQELESFYSGGVDD